MNASELARSELDSLSVRSCHGSVPQYNERFMQLVSQLPDLSTAQLIHVYMKGLSPVVRRSFFGDLPTDLSVAMARADRVFRQEGLWQEPSAPTAAAVTHNDPKPMELGLLTKKEHRSVCWVCGSPNHRAFKCPERKR